MTYAFISIAKVSHSSFPDLCSFCIFKKNGLALLTPQNNAMQGMSHEQILDNP